MMDRVKDMGSLAGQLHAERMLEQQENIPKELRKFYLVFTGTVWRFPVGPLVVPYLIWGGGNWNLDFYWLGHNFRSLGRLARLSK